MPESFRIYGKTLTIWKAFGIDDRERIFQRELEYTEYDAETMEIVGTGSEDFSTERYNYELEERWLWTWDGNKRNKGGHRWFELHGYIRYRKSDRAKVKAYYKQKYNATEVQLRK